MDTTFAVNATSPVSRAPAATIRSASASAAGNTGDCGMLAAIALLFASDGTALQDSSFTSASRIRRSAVGS